MDLSTDDLDIPGLSLGAAAAVLTAPLARLATAPLDHGTAFAVGSGVLVLGVALAGWVANRAPPEDWLLQAGVSGLLNWVVATVVSGMVMSVLFGGGADLGSNGILGALYSSATLVWPGHVIGVAIARSGIDPAREERDTGT